MKTLLLVAMLAMSAQACIAPIKPIPPIGCGYDDAMLVNDGESCYWVFVNCG